MHSETYYDFGTMVDEVVEARKETLRNFIPTVEPILSGVANYSLDPDQSIRLIVNDKLESYTDGKNVTVSLMPFFLDPKYSESFWTLVMKASTAHECQHVNSSDIKAANKMAEEFAKWFFDNYKINQNIGRNIAFQVSNMFEDGRIESIITKKTPGLLINFKIKNGEIRWNARILKKATTAQEEFQHFNCEILSYSKCGGHAPGVEVYHGERMEQVFMHAKHMIDKAVNARTCGLCLKHTKEFLMDVAPYMADLLRADSDFMDAMEKMVSKLDWGGSCEDTEQNPDGESPLRILMLMPSDDDSDDEGSGQSGQSSDPKDDGEDENGSGSGSASDDKEDGKDGSDPGASKDGKEDPDGSGSNGSGGDSKDKDDTKDGKSGSGSDSDSKDKGDDANGDGDQDGKSAADGSSDQSGKGEDGKDGDSDANRGGKDGKADGKMPMAKPSGLQKAPDADSKSGGIVTGKDDFSNVRFNNRGYTEDELKQAEERLRLTEESKKASAESYYTIEASRKTSFRHTHVNKIKSKENVKEIFITPMRVPMPKDLLRIIAKNQPFIQNILFKRQTHNRARENGILDGRAITRLISQRELVLSGMDRGKYEVVFYLLIDNSGSMACDDKSTAARRAAAIIEALFGEIVPIKIVLFNSWDCIRHTVIKDFDFYDKKLNASYSSLRDDDCRACGGNRDGHYIRYATDEMMKRPERKKVLIVLSDGMPSDSCYANPIEDVKDAVAYARQKGLDVISIMFGNEAIRLRDNYVYMYQHNIISASTDQIIPELLKIFKNIMR